MQTFRSIHLQKHLGDVLRTADVEAVVIMNREQPRTVFMSADEFIRLKEAAGEPVPPEVRKTRPVLHRAQSDPLGYDTRDPLYSVRMAEDAIHGRHADELKREAGTVLKRWGMSR